MEGEPAKPDTPPAEERIDWVKRYNLLVEEAKSIGLEGVRPVTSRFRDTATGAKRCQALESSIKARREGLAAAERQEAASPQEPVPLPSEEERGEAPASQETEVMSTATKRKTTAKAPAKAKPAKAPVKALPSRGVIVEDFNPRRDSNLESLVKLLADNKNKLVTIGDMLKAVYGSKDTKNRSALSGVIKGVEVRIEEGLSRKYKLEHEGRGEEAKYKLTVR